MELLLRQGEWDVVDPASAGWRYLSFRVEGIKAGDHVPQDTGGEEIAIVPLQGTCLVESNGMRWELGGRASVFEGMPWALYLPRGTQYTVSAFDDVEVAVCGALADEQHEPRLVTPEEVEIEVRGSGNATRQINHILKPEFPAHRLLVVEVFTPAGNWSSYPPHKHDTEDPPRESYLEELYYYRLAKPTGFAFQRIYTPDRSLDEALVARDGDLVLVPRGYHVVATAPGYDCYYLNVMAGPTREWRFTVDPDHVWLMDWDPARPRR